MISDSSSGSGSRQGATIQPSLFDPLPEPVVEPPAPLDAPPDAHSARLVSDAPPPLAPFNAAGILDAADVHVATTLGRLLGEERDEVVLAAAFAVRGPRLGHVCVDLAALPRTVAADTDMPVDVGGLPWPDPDPWLDAVTTSPLVAHDDDPTEAPLRLIDGRLYLDRYWRYERLVADGLTRRAGTPPPDVDLPTLRDGLARLFGGDGDGPDLQRLAAAAAVLRPFTVVAGGPGTGKTTTVAQILVLLDEQATARGDRPPRIALAAPTGKAASRLEESIREAAGRIDGDPAVRERLADASASTIHRLLGNRPGSRTRFRHDAATPLPHDVVVIDETSMVSLALMAKLIDAVRPDARLVLVGDPDQLASVEAGAVLGDIVGPARERLLISRPVRDQLSDATGEAVPAADPPRGARIADGIVVLRTVHRFAGGIAELARAVQSGDGDAALAVLAAGRDDVAWIETDPEAGAPVEIPEPLKEVVVEAGRATVVAARDGDAPAALAALGALRVLCAHRRGPHGVAGWVPRIERWLAAEVDGFDPGEPWHVGRPVLVTENDHELQLYNGDQGVVVAQAGDRVAVAFQGSDGVRLLHPARLGPIETVHAMTIHKSQGSQFGHAVVVLPDANSPLLTRELLYTAVTRAREAVTVVGSTAAVARAASRPIQRASGLHESLWRVWGAQEVDRGPTSLSQPRAT